MPERTLRRRRFLRFGGAGIAGILAGCPGGDGGSNTTTPGESDGTTITTTVRPTTTLEPTTTSPASDGGTTTSGESDGTTTGGTTTTTSGGTTTTTGGTTTTTAGGTTTTTLTTTTETPTPVPVTTEYQDDVLSDSETGAIGFGTAVAFDEDTALIGAPHAPTDGPGTGMVYAYYRERGRWSREDVLVPEEGSENEAFGTAVAIDGDIAVVGAAPADESSAATGSAYAFSRTFASWNQQGVLDPGGLSAGDNYGETAAMVGTTGIIGAPGAGEVHTFGASGGEWSFNATISETEGGEDRFGSGLDVHEDILAIGAGRTSLDAGEGAGTIYLYESTAGGWGSTHTITPEDPSAGDRFGEDVAIGSEYLVGGAPGADPSGEDSGTAYVFQEELGDWHHVDTLVATDGDAADDFGRSVEISGKTAIVGAPHDEDPDGSDAGSAYVFFGDVPAWRQEAKLLPREGQPDAGFGADIAVVGKTVLVGTGAAEGVHGAGYVFDR